MNIRPTLIQRLTACLAMREECSCLSFGPYDRLPRQECVLLHRRFGMRNSCLGFKVNLKEYSLATIYVLKYSIVPPYISFSVFLTPIPFSFFLTPLLKNVYILNPFHPCTSFAFIISTPQLVTNSKTKLVSKKKKKNTSTVHSELLTPKQAFSLSKLILAYLLACLLRLALVSQRGLIRIYFHNVRLL